MSQLEYIQTAYGKIPSSELKIKTIPGYPRIKLCSYLSFFHNEKVDKLGQPFLVKLKKESTELVLQELQKERASDWIGNNAEYFRIRGSPHKITLPCYLDPKLAYLVGYLYGDGGLKDIYRSYQISGRFEHKIIVGDEFRIQIEEIIKPLFKQIFNLNTTVRTERINKGINMYYLNPTCKLVYRFLVKVFHFSEGPKNKIILPELLLSSPKTIRRWFLRGFIDADGDTRATEHYINRSLPSPRIKIRLADKQFVIVLKSLLNTDFDLGFTGPYSDTNRDWYIQTAKAGTINAYKRNLFKHPIKIWRLEKFVQLLRQ